MLEGAWLEPGMTVVSFGSTLPELREFDPEVIRRAVRIVADRERERDADQHQETAPDGADHTVIDPDAGRRHPLHDRAH